MRSMETDSQRRPGISSGLSVPFGLVRSALSRWQESHSRHQRLTSAAMLGPKYSCLAFCKLKPNAPKTGAHVVITHPGPKARWTLYVHTQESVSHSLLRVAVCNKTVVIRLSVACGTFCTKERVVTNRVAYVLYAGLMPHRQAITMIIIYCSKPQQTDAVNPTPLAHRSHSCMRALALGHDTCVMHKCRVQLGRSFEASVDILYPRCIRPATRRQPRYPLRHSITPMHVRGLRPGLPLKS